MSDLEEKERRWKMSLAKRPPLPRFRFLGAKPLSFLAGGVFVIATATFLEPNTLHVTYMGLFVAFMVAVIWGWIEMRSEHKDWSKEFAEQGRESHEAWMDYLVAAKKRVEGFPEGYAEGEEWKNQ